MAGLNIFAQFAPAEVAKLRGSNQPESSLIISGLIVKQIPFRHFLISCPRNTCLIFEGRFLIHFEKILVTAPHCWRSVIGIPQVQPNYWLIASHSTIWKMMIDRLVLVYSWIDEHIIRRSLATTTQSSPWDCSCGFMSDLSAAVYHLNCHH